MKKLYEMSEEDLQVILQACQPTPIMYLSGGQPMFRSPQENANDSWKALGRKMSFVWDTAEPSGKGQRFFLAEPLEKKS